jgi:hypothetical protein
MISRFTRLAIAACAALLLGGCLPGCNTIGDQGSANPIGPACRSPADNLQLCAYANYGTFVVMEELALKVAEDPALSNDIRQAIIKADERAKPVADSLYGAIRQYERIRIEVAQGKTPEEKLLTAAANLNRWVTEAAPLVQQLVEAVNSAGKKG